MPAVFDLLIPTRGRPLNVDRLLSSIEDTAADPARIRCYFRVDSDDAPMIGAIASLRERHPKVAAEYIVGERSVLASHYTEMAKTTTGDILWSGGDDIVFRTKGWDAAIQDEFAAIPDLILLVYGNDRLQGHRLATHPFISRQGFDALGYFYPNTGKISVTDLWLHHAYETIGRLKYRPDLITEHVHWLRRDADGNRLAEYDATYAGQYENNLPEVMATLQLFQDDLVRGINTLLAHIRSPYRVSPTNPAPKETAHAAM